MRKIRTHSRSDDESDLNLTPMLDVVFIMLIFFIVTATFIKQAGIDVFRPDALTFEQKPTVSVLVAISESGEIWIDKKQVDPTAVAAHIERLHIENPKGGLVIQADRNAKYQVLKAVLDAARAVNPERSGDSDGELANRGAKWRKRGVDGSGDSEGGIRMITRYVIGVTAGLVVTFFLFLLMQALIKSDKSPFSDADQGRILDFVRLQEDQELVTKKRKPKPPPPPDEPPPDMPKPDFDSSVSQGVEIGGVDVNVDVNLSGTGGFSADGEYLPIVKVAPIYPRRAQTRGIEGYVLLEFVVMTTGAVRDPIVVDAKPPGIFDRAAIQAALKFKYKPKVVNGEPVEVAGVRNLIKFELEDG